MSVGVEGNLLLTYIYVLTYYIPHSGELFTKAEFKCILSSNLTYITCLEALVSAAATS